MTLEQTLVRAGLASKEVRVYLACLTHGPETVAVMSRHARMQRSTLYHVLEALLRKGFVISTTKGKRTVYDAERPESLLTMLREREKELEDVMPELSKLRGVSDLLPRTVIHEGPQGIQKLYNEIFTYMEKNNDVCMLTAIEDVEQHAPFALEEYSAVLRKKPEALVKELILPDAYGKKYARAMRKAGFRQPLRFLPVDTPVHNDMILFDGKAALFSFKRRPFATVIDDVDIVQTLTALFDAAWAAGKKVA